MNVRVKRVALARETQVIPTTRLASVRFANVAPFLLIQSPTAERNAHRLFGNRAVRFGPDVEQVVAAIARAG